MTRKFIQAENISLSYIEANAGNDPILFFVHGISVCSDFWERQIKSELLEGFHLIAIDLPAHGCSDASLHPERDYTISGLGRLTAAAVQTLAAGRPYVLVGMSLGTNIVTEALAFLPGTKGLALSGPSIVGMGIGPERFIKPGTNVGVMFVDQADAGAVAGYAAELMENGSHIKEFTTCYDLVKAPFRSVLGASIANREFSDEIRLLQQFRPPVLVLFGRDEKVIDPDYLDRIELNLWQGKIFKVPGASHFVNIDQPDVFNRLLLDYAQAVTQTG